MSRVKKTNTKPELIVRQIAHRLGYRFRLYRKDLPGNPDLTFTRLKKVIFVHGCFWHRHDCRLGGRLPTTRPEYWTPKLERNVERDRLAEVELCRLGWDVLVVWECETRDGVLLVDKIATFLNSKTELDNG
ncbi:very short patch repair endonuclease [Mesorhizobium sp.]|uniref:very short patch repair endonuclease n=1 Tax=Mesorhizobium sp. TaxID=1871066 RepID=UPI000FE4AF91|nr:very short patch repair endonuclease [Mesorhizobium sp.]RWG42965.1 MAG: DNA mismatch endonuclease Vsr [Mesorhizobium sp.]RWI28745.1 MAG: DNA mismatch endonuclease Vsr [Mesorhizobium sp.]RWK45491.1 MAG: DNA mismatch endonuclease Vsr [Mesorhizobium sp.]RWK91709.1 MAG: DNA mismatch endonuclease Vsr [Mesorhizobium sp.]RWK96640.1 MAG: DNA mismatch endonuclease Vsr [Mesorhizobium sp.]